MLRTTAVKIANGKITRQSAKKINEAIHEKFTPPLEWHLKCRMVANFHYYKTQRHCNWSIYDTIKALDISKQYLYQSLKLSFLIARYPHLRGCKTRRDALRLSGTLGVRKRHHKPGSLFYRDAAAYVVERPDGSREVDKYFENLDIPSVEINYDGS